MLQICPVKTSQLYLLTLLSAVLLSVAWPANGFSFLIFIAFVPLLRVEYHFYKKPGSSWHNVLGHSYITFLVWNLLTTYWVWNSSEVGGVLAFSLNSLFMAMVFTLFHIIHKRLGDTMGYAALICFWIGYEYLHQDWDLSWTWLILGNVFSENWKAIQWYEYTGVFGGTLWVWLLNILIFYRFRNTVHLMKVKVDYTKKQIAGIVALLVVPMLVSLAIYYSYVEKIDPINVVAVQPNIDPYNEKFDGMTASEQLNKMLGLAEQKVTPKTQYLVGPETALVEGIVENNIEDFQSIHTIREYLKGHPQLKVVIGISSYREYSETEPRPNTAHHASNRNIYYDSYNTASQIDTSHIIQLYHKSKLVPGVEKMPFGDLLKPLQDLAFSLGGMSGSLGLQDDREVFTSPGDTNLKIAPVVCYESIYGEYVGEYVRNGADVIFIITNDGWWGDTPGYKQHCSYARLRAIEHRRSIARSANTGISCFIDQRGETTQTTPYWKEAVISADINQNHDFTFYTLHGDYIARAALVLSLMFVGLGVVKKRKMG